MPRGLPPVGNPSILRRLRNDRPSSYWDTMLHGIVNGTSGVFLLSSGVQGIASFLNGDICALSSDGYHYADSLFSDHVGEGKDGAKYAEAICKFCGEHFLCYATDLPPAYDDYVETLPASGYNSDGSLLYSPRRLTILSSNS